MKVMKAVLVAALVLAMAAPAMAEIKLNGYFRVQGNIYDNDVTSDQFFVQRTRFKLTDQLNENVKLVYYVEADNDWGQSGKGAIGGGAKLGNDGVLIETKHAYVETNYDGFTTTVGLQWFGDGFNSFYLDDDAAGITVAKDFGGFNVNAWYAKFDESVKTTWSDYDAYGATFGIAASDALSLDAKVNYYDNNRDEETTLVYGLGAGFKISDSMSLNALVAFEKWEEDVSAGADGSTWFTDIALKAGFDGGDVKLRGFYSPAGDNANDAVHMVSDFGFYEDNLILLGYDASATNQGKDGNYSSSLTSGYGLVALTLSGNYQLPSDFYLKYGVGYFAAEDDTVAGVKVADKEIGTEFALRVGKKFLGNVDLSVRGSFLSAGDFNGPDTNDQWATKIGRAHV